MFKIVKKIKIIASIGEKLQVQEDIRNKLHSILQDRISLNDNYTKENQQLFFDLIVRNCFNTEIEKLTGKEAIHAESGLTFKELRNRRGTEN